MTAYRYWITYEGRVTADEEESAYNAARRDFAARQQDETRHLIPLIEVEAEGEDVEL